MLSGSANAFGGLVHSGLVVLLASPDPVLVSDLSRIFGSMGLRVESVMDGQAALDAIRTLEDPAVVLLDVKLAGVSGGRLLAAMSGAEIRMRCAIALIAEQVSDEWIAKLSEGIIDDIVPWNADSNAWGMHLSRMQRGHELYCELEHLRQAAVMEVRHDRVTGTFHRETMLKIIFRETDRVQRLHGSLCLILFDLDDFAHWNNELGRDACDGLLRETAMRTGRILRSYDLVSRAGNDEFLLALPGCSAVNAAMMADRLRIEVFGEFFALKDWRGNTLQIKLTACYAIASSRGRSPVVVLREAEQTLEQAKLSGPDTVRCAGDSLSSAGTAAGLNRLFPEPGVLSHKL